MARHAPDFTDAKPAPELSRGHTLAMKSTHLTNGISGQDCPRVPFTQRRNRSSGAGSACAAAIA